MENNIEITTEVEIKTYESICGKLTDNFPFTYTIAYNNNQYSTGADNTLKLNPDGTFELKHLIIGCDDDYHYIKMIPKGSFTYSAAERKLTLNILEKGEQRYFEGDFWDNDTQTIDKLINTITKLEVNNFFWTTKIMDFPWISIPLLTNDPVTLDFFNPIVKFFKMKYQHFLNTDEFNSLVDRITIFSTGKEFATTITEPLIFHELTLNPNGTLDFKSIDYNWDSDGDWKWDGSFTCSGRWVYYATSKTIKLLYSNYEIKNNHNVILDVSNMDLPKEHETNNFYFESSFINSIYVDSYYGNYQGNKMALLKRS